MAFLRIKEKFVTDVFKLLQTFLLHLTTDSVIGFALGQLTVLEEIGKRFFEEVLGDLIFLWVATIDKFPLDFSDLLNILQDFFGFEYLTLGFDIEHGHEPTFP